MKKIMFKDQYGLTNAVLERKKTMTRRIVPNKAIIAPTYYVGEEVAIAQSYSTLNQSGYIAPEWLEHSCESSAGYRNKMFVRADLMPHSIKISSVEGQLLQEISDEDCLREGVMKWLDCYIVTGIMENQGQSNVCFDTPREAFAALIDRINGKGTWESNPRVYAYGFELLR